MYDRETESLWVHASGRARSGAREGWQLKLFPSTVTTWAQWKATYPTTLVLDGRRRGGFMGTYTGTADAARLGLSVVVGFKAKLYPFALLKEHIVINDKFNAQSVVVVYTQTNGTARALNRSLNGRILTFSQSTERDSSGMFMLRDNETGSDWSWLTGKAISGVLKGSALEFVPHHPILLRRFSGFYPDGPILNAEDARALARRP